MPTDFSMISDVRLMELVREGRRDAFVEIVHRYQRILVNFFVRMNASYSTAEDLVQTTFVRLYEYRDRYRPSAPLGAFLHTLALRAWVDWTRKERRQPELVDKETLDSEPKDGGVGRIEDRMDLLAALGSLSEKLRSVVVLTYFQGLSHQDVALVLDIPVGTVKSRLFLAMEELRKRLAENE
jgi:RNA polymerase sigma-70 factor, ECF subfamily